MVCVRGPRTALSNFIEEHGIKIEDLRKKRAEVGPVRPTETKKNRKKIQRLNRPIELSNIDKTVKKLEDILLDKVYSNESKFVLSDSQLEMYSAYLSRNRLMNIDRFHCLAGSSQESLIVHDCSMITSSEFLAPKNLKKLELHFCGQIEEEALNAILKDMDQLRVLRITGAYLLEEFDLPRNLKVMDLSGCSRISDRMIEKINKEIAELEELRLSGCYYLTGQCELKVRVKELFICETMLSEKFLRGIPNLSEITRFSIKRCPNILSYNRECPSLNFDDFDLIEYLDLEGISTIKDLKIGKTLKCLNIAHCYGLTNVISQLEGCDQLEVLNISRLNLGEDELRKIVKFKNLRLLRASWCRDLNDGIVLLLVRSLGFLEEIHVFGCFNITENLGRLSWEMRANVRIIGNPSETSYLLEN
jgi:hypothetical protein